VVWSNDRGGTGIASSTTAWSIAGVPLRTGTNTIRVTAFDAANHATTATLVVVSSNGGAIPATITAQPIDQASDVGLTATFAITAVDAPPLTYQWESAPSASATFATIAGATSASYTTPTITAGMNGTQYRCTVVSNGASSALSSSARLLIPRPADGAAGGAAGLDFRFYLAGDGNLPNFPALTPTTTGTVTNFDLTPRAQDSNFSFQFQGYLAVPTDGSYTLFTTSDDGSRLFIGSTIVVENNGQHGMQEASGSIALKAGLHAILVRFSQGAGGLGLEVRWQGTGIAKALIPASALFRTLSGAATAPALTTQPGNQAVIVGQTATFIIAASGAPTPTFQWQKNTTNISGATNASYTTPATVIGDNGATYRCVVTNSAGTATSNAGTLTVTTTPDTTPPPKPSMPSMSGNGTANPTLSGTAEAGATITLREGSTVVTTTVATGGTWTLTPTLSAGSHTLTVTATDAAGNVSVASDPVTVTVAAGSGPGPAPATGSNDSSGKCGSGSGIAALMLGLALSLSYWRRRN